VRLNRTNQNGKQKKSGSGCWISNAARIDLHPVLLRQRARAKLYERFSTFMDRFYVGRWKRWVFIEPASEAATNRVSAA